MYEQATTKSTPQAFASNGSNIYTSCLTNKHEFGTAFFVDSKVNHLVTNFTPINEGLCIRSMLQIVKCRFFNYSLINIHASTNDSEEKAKDQFYEQLKRAYSACPENDVKLVMEDVNAKVGRGTVRYRLQDSTNENGLH
jgi:NACalpha-BTF3-like transcription factor